MKRILSLLIAVLVVLSFTACEETGVLLAENGRGIVDLFQRTGLHTLAEFDLDFDGTYEMFSYRAAEDGGYELNIGRRDEADFIYTYKLPDAADAKLWVVDCDMTDSRLELLFNGTNSNGDPTLAAIRVKEDGSGFEVFEIHGLLDVPDDYKFDHKAGFPVTFRTDIPGAERVTGYLTVTKDGFKLISETLKPVKDN